MLLARHGQARMDGGDTGANLAAAIFPSFPAPSAEEHLRVKYFVGHRFLHGYPKQWKGTVRRKLNPDEAGFSRAGMDESRLDSIPNEV
jgi:hypothetical protein